MFPSWERIIIRRKTRSGWGWSVGGEGNLRENCKIMQPVRYEGNIVWVVENRTAGNMGDGVNTNVWGKMPYRWHTAVIREVMHSIITNVREKINVVIITVRKEKCVRKHTERNDSCERNHDERNDSYKKNHSTYLHDNNHNRRYTSCDNNSGKRRDLCDNIDNKRRN